jgi:hypothetical protein
MKKERISMGFEVDNKKHPDLWDRQPEYNNPLNTPEQPKIQPEKNDKEPKIVRTDRRERKKRQQRISFIAFAVAFLAALSMPFVIGHFKRWQVDRYEKEHENDPSMLQNNIYTTAFCTNVAYPKGVEFAGYTAQGYVKPYELTIHVNGSAAKNEYNMAAAMAFNVFKDLGTVNIVEDETGKEYVFRHET